MISSDSKNPIATLIPIISPKKNILIFLSNNNHLIADTTVGAISILPLFTTSLNLAGDIALGIVAGSSVIKLGIDYINNTKLNKLYKLFVNELMDRFETPQLAYLEISNLIQSVEREDIINYFKLIGVDYNANK